MSDIPTFDDDLLPEPPAPKTPPPKDPETGRFVSPKQPQAVAPESGPAASSSASGYVLARARRLGIPNPDQMDAATLEQWLTWADAREQQNRPAPPKPAEEVEPAFDWGKDDDGPYTEERLKKEFPMMHRVKEYADQRVAKAEKLLKQVQDERQAEKADRATRAIRRKAFEKMAAHPKIFGEKPHETVAGSPERRRVEAVFRELSAIGAENNRNSLDHLDEDIARAIELLVPPEPARPGGQPPRPTNGVSQPRTAAAADLYQRAELARPTERRTYQALTRREAELAQEAEKLRENGQAVPADWGQSDDDDLPDAY